MHHLLPILNKEEIHILKILNHVINKDMYIWPKLKVGDRLKPNIDKNNAIFWKAYEIILNQDVSYIIFNKTTFEPLLIIHPEYIPVEHRKAFDIVFNTLEIPIIYIDFSEYKEYKEEFTYDSLHHKIKEALDK